jgi:Uma2 family endonuclease
MPTFKVPVYGDVHVPAWVVTLDAFRRWIHEGDLPEKLKVHFIRGEVWTDFYIEEMFSHNRVKTALGITLGGLIEGEQLGLYVSDGMLLTNEDADLGTTPDAMFVSNRTIESGRVKFASGVRKEAQATELIGTPDLAVEIVSPSSEGKDTEWLMSGYWNAGVPEYWLIDARSNPPVFNIYKRGPKGYSEARQTNGWVKSAILKRSFRLTRTKGVHGLPVYHLGVR